MELESLLQQDPKQVASELRQWSELENFPVQTKDQLVEILGDEFLSILDNPEAQAFFKALIRELQHKEDLGEIRGRVRQAICAIRRKSTGQHSGTGFLVAQNLVLTCWHVVEQMVADAEVVFDYDQNSDWQAIDTISITQLLAYGFTDTHDFALVEIASVTNREPLSMSQERPLFGERIFSFGYPGMTDSSAPCPLYQTPTTTVRTRTSQSHHPTFNYDLTISPDFPTNGTGFSGSPIIREADGAVIGIHQWAETGQLRTGIQALGILERLAEKDQLDQINIAIPRTIDVADRTEYMSAIKQDIRYHSEQRWLSTWEDVCYVTFKHWRHVALSLSLVVISTIVFMFWPSTFPSSVADYQLQDSKINFWWNEEWVVEVGVNDRKESVNSFKGESGGHQLQIHFADDQVADLRQLEKARLAGWITRAPFGLQYARLLEPKSEDYATYDGTFESFLEADLSELQQQYRRFDVSGVPINGADDEEIQVEFVKSDIPSENDLATAIDLKGFQLSADREKLVEVEGSTIVKRYFEDVELTPPPESDSFQVDADSNTFRATRGNATFDFSIESFSELPDFNWTDRLKLTADEMKLENGLVQINEVKNVIQSLTIPADSSPDAIQNVADDIISSWNNGNTTLLKFDRRLPLNRPFAPQSSFFTVKNVARFDVASLLNSGDTERFPLEMIPNTIWKVSNVITYKDGRRTIRMDECTDAE